MSYTNKEIEIIVENCNTDKQLQDVCSSFIYLIENKCLKKSTHLTTVTMKKYIELNLK